MTAKVPHGDRLREYRDPKRPWLGLKDEPRRFACLLCKREDGPVHVWSESRTGPLETVACAHCGLVQTHPAPTAEEVAAYYASGEYRREFQPLPLFDLDAEDPGRAPMVEPDDPRYPKMQDAHAEHTAERLARGAHMVPGMAILEVGCGDGRVSAALRDMGLNVWCREADPNKRAEAEARGCVFADEADRGTFDLVFALQVAEHFADPVQGLHSEIVTWAKVGGDVLLEVPCIERPYVSLTHFFQRPHVVNYSQHTVRAAMGAAGLADVSTAIDGSVLIAAGTRDSHIAMIDPDEMPGGAEVAAELHRWERERVKAARLAADGRARREAVEALLAERELTPEQRTLAAEEFARWAHCAGEAVGSLVDLSRGLEQAKREDWHADPWVRGFLAGRIYEGQRVGMAIDAATNAVGYWLNKPKEAA